MKAYDETHIRNQFIVTQAERWQRQQLLTPAQLTAVRQAYPFPFRNGSVFIDIGLFIFTLVSAGGGFGLLAVMLGEFTGGNRTAEGTVSLTVGMAAVFLTVMLTNRGTYYRNGVDNASILVATVYLVAGVHLLLPTGLPLWLDCLINLPVLLAVIWYFGDLLIAFAALGTVYTLIFSGMLEFSLGKTLLPFVLMGVSGLGYGLARQFPKHTRSLYYTDVLTLTEWVTLIVLAASVNYAVVRQLNGLLMTPSPAEAPEIAFSGLFWALTCLIPTIYLALGLRRKDRILLILGILGLVAAVATVRVYVVWLSFPLFLVVCGAVLIAIAVVTVRLLKADRSGFTDAPDDESPRAFWGTAQTLAAMQGASGTHPPEGIKFGGGDFGGGGAEGKY